MFERVVPAALEVESAYSSDNSGFWTAWTGALGKSLPVRSVSEILGHWMSKACSTTSFHARDAELLRTQHCRRQMG